MAAAAVLTAAVPFNLCGCRLGWCGWFAMPRRWFCSPLVLPLLVCSGLLPAVLRNALYYVHYLLDAALLHCYGCMPVLATVPPSHMRYAFNGFMPLLRFLLPVRLPEQRSAMPAGCLCGIFSCGL
ncbi:hypothetical protein AVEN_167941-1 [Araneus ventricosus]|uniref:Uncharacterized protein n=1 Tax=Araneus ventricosus TaxID=182803 RepID=A0A4Y2KDU8_ARAVE|nr:hypothetical protein AVEN_167941-1 [Araneus ventricosus]